ncbi:MAG: hypothetical protein NT106_11095 [Candidatus Sumerlaeota bacterium]|nr:hypothetical protein [Candidatus Sumerlaeota bacterium]
MRKNILLCIISLLCVGSLAFGSLTWTSTSLLPVPIRGGTVVYNNGYVYSIGGRPSSESSTTRAVNNVYYVSVNADGSLGTWQATTSLPAKRAMCGAYAYNGKMYVWGGWDEIYITMPTCYYASINPDGSLGSWTTSSVAIPDDGGISQMDCFGRGVLGFGKYIYIIGGERNDVVYVPTVYYSEIQTSGDFGPWNTTTSLPIGYAFHGVVTYQGSTANYIYLIGGSIWEIYLIDIYYNTINANGTLGGTWTKTAALLDTACFDMGIACVADNIFVMGGLANSLSPLDLVQRCMINPATGDITQVSIETDLPGPRGRTMGVGYAISDKNYVLNVGGSGSGSPVPVYDTCFYTQFSLTMPTPTPTPSPTPILTPTPTGTPVPTPTPTPPPGPTPTPGPTPGPPPEPSQILQWAKRAGSAYNGDFGRGIDTFPDGSAVVTGDFSSTATFGLGETHETTLVPVAYSDIFIARYNADGTLAWAKRAGGTDYDSGGSIAALPDGSSIVTGYFIGSATFGPGETYQTILSSSGNPDIFIAKYGSTGQLVWAKKAGGTDVDYGRGVAALAGGQSFITGTFRGSATFGAGEANETPLASSGQEDIFLAKYDVNGSLLWAKKAGGSDYDYAYSIAVLSDGSSFITGRFFGTASFGGINLTSAGSGDIFIAKYDTSGTPVWVKRAGGTSNDYGYSVCALQDGSPLVAGTFYLGATFGAGEAGQTVLSGSKSDIFIAKYNSTGTLVWAKKAGGAETDVAMSVAAFSDGSSIVTGYFGYNSSSGSSATFGAGETHETKLTSAGYEDIFIAHYKSDGTLSWVKQAGRDRHDFALGVAISSTDDTWITGYFTGTAIFGLGESGRTDLTSAGMADIFIAKYSNPGTSPTPTPLPPPPETVGFDDHFYGPSLDLTRWEVTAGSTPPVASSKVTIHNCGIRTKDYFRALPLWLEIKGVHYVSLPLTIASMDFSLIGDKDIIYCGMEATNPGTPLEGYFFGYGGLQGWTTLYGYPSLPTDTFDIVFKVDTNGARLFLRGHEQMGLSYMTPMAYASCLALYAGGGASFTVDRVYIHSTLGGQTNPAYCLIPPGAYNEFSFGTTGVSLQLSNLTSQYGYVKIEKFSGKPAGFTLPGPPCYWRIEGLGGPYFMTDILFDYDLAELASLGLVEEELQCYRSYDNGATWELVDGILDKVNHHYIANGIYSFSLWVLGAPTTSVSAPWAIYD